MQKQIILEEFQGSLELLLHLVRRSEIPIEQLTLHDIISQLISAVEEEDPCIEEHTESLAPAASLLLLKSRYLLPVQEEEDDESVSLSPKELMQHVVDYCHFKEAASQMTEREKEQAGRYRRQAHDPLPKPPKGSGVQHMGLTDLVELVHKALSNVSKPPQTVIAEEEWKIADAMTTLHHDLTERSQVPFDHYFNTERARGEMIVFFLAILEMMKRHELRVDEGVLVAL